MKPNEQVGDFYVPEGTTRNLRFPGDWFWFRGGTLITMVEVAELDTDGTLLLRQYGADQLLLQLLDVSPDPSDWVEVSRFEGQGWDVGQEPVEDVSDAM